MVNGYLVFHSKIKNCPVKVLFYNGEPSLFSEKKKGVKAGDDEIRWRSVISKRRSKEIVQEMEDLGIFKALNEVKNEIEDHEKTEETSS